MKYRIVKSTKATGVVYWIVQKKWLWWWEFVELFSDQEKALSLMTKLKNGTPEETREVVWQ